jgi:hypothetical protein
MVEGRREAVRRNLVAQAALVWGQIDDLQQFIATGRAEAKPEYVGQPAPVTEDVARYAQAMERAGRFLMPDEVDKWLKDEAAEQQAADRPEVASGAAGNPTLPSPQA